MEQPKALRIFFIELGDGKSAPVKLAESTFSFCPVFNKGDQLTFKRGKDGDRSEFNARGTDATHTVKNVHWLLSVIEYKDDEGTDAETDAMPLMIVHLEPIKPKRPVRVTHRDGN